MMTRAEVAAYARCSTKSVWRATQEFRRTGGRSGLRYFQRGGPGSTLLFRLSDVDRWLDAECSSLRRSG
jgi:hypothetical protein